GNSPNILGAGNAQRPQVSAQERERRGVVVPPVAEAEARANPEDLSEVAVRQNTVAHAPRRIPVGAGDGHVPKVEGERSDLVRVEVPIIAEAVGSVQFPGDHSRRGRLDGAAVEAAGAAKGEQDV